MVKIDKILVPIDFSENSEKAVQYAVEIGRDRNAKLFFVHVISQRILGAVQELNVRGYQGDFMNAARKLVQDRERQLREFVPIERLGKLQAEFLVREGVAWEQVIGVAKEFTIDLVVLGSKGHSALASILIGSVAQNVLHHAPCPVLMVKPTEHDFISSSTK